MDKFLRAIVAERPLECDINRIVRAADLTIGTSRDSIGCVGAITKTYHSGGPRALCTTLRILRDSYGIPGFASKVTEGMGIFVTNYENVFNEEALVARLSAKKGGVTGLRGEAEIIKIKYGVSVATAVAAAIVETYNRPQGARRGPRLQGWWDTLNETESS